MNQDEEHLRLLSIFHYVLGGITALFACFPFIHLALGIALLSGALPDDRGQAPPAFVGYIVVGIAGTMILLGWCMALLILLAGRRLARQTNHTFCFVAAAIECMMVPLGTVLGVFTIVVLNRPSVKALFQARAAENVWHS